MCYHFRFPLPLFCTFKYIKKTISLLRVFTYIINFQNIDMKIKTIVFLLLLSISLFSMKVRMPHTVYECYDTVSEMREKKDQKEASLQDKLIESVSEYTRQDCAECYTQHCYRIEYLD